MDTGVALIISSICNATFCENVYDNPLVEQQLSHNQNVLRELAREVNGKHLKIASYSNFPLSWIDEGDNGTLVGKGVAFVLVNILSKKFNFTYDVVRPEKNFEVGGTRPEESLIGLVNNSMVDMAAAFLPTLMRYRQKVTFSTVLDEGTWVMMLKRPKESATGSGLLAPFKNHVWYMTLAAVLCYGPCITLLTRIRANIIKDDNYCINLSPSFWFVYGAFIKQGTTLAPDANTTRVLFATWWIFIILLSAFYTANLTAFLTLSRFTLDIEYAHDLYKKNYRWVAQEGGAVQFIIQNPNEELHYLQQMVQKGRAEFRSLSQSVDYLPLVVGGAVLVKERIAVDHLMYTDYLVKAKAGVVESDRCTYVVAPNAFMSKIRAFAYPIGSKLNVLFDPVLAHLVQAGIVKFLANRDLPSTKICPLDLQSKDRQLRNSDLMMTYMIMITGLSAAAAVFIGEIVFKRYIHIKIRKNKGDKPKKKKTNKRIRFYEHDDAHPPPYDALFGKSSKYKTENSTKKIVNGREYWVVDTVNGDSRLIPVRTPSAFLYR